MRFWVSSVFSVMMLLVSAQAAAEITARVLEYGYYQNTKPTQRMRNDELPSGYERSGGKASLAKQTQQIPMAKGLLFGFKFEIKGFPKDQVAAKLQLKVTHPEMIRPDGSKRSGYSYPIPMHIWNGGITENTGYRFDKGFELVEGEWRFEYWLKDKMLISQTFQVVKQAEALPQDLLREARRAPKPESKTLTPSAVAESAAVKDVAKKSDKTAVKPAAVSSVAQTPEVMKSPLQQQVQQPVQQAAKVVKPIAVTPVAQVIKPPKPVTHQPVQQSVAKVVKPVPSVPAAKSTQMLAPVALQSTQKSAVKPVRRNQTVKAEPKPEEVASTTNKPSAGGERQESKEDASAAPANNKLSPEFQKKISEIMNKFKSKAP